MKKIIKWFKDIIYQDIIIIEHEGSDIKLQNVKNSKIVINGKVVFDNTENKNNE